MWVCMIFYEAFIRSRLTYACQTWTLTVEQFRKLDSADVHLKRRMINNGFRRRPIENDDDEGKIMPYVYYNEDVHRITKSSILSNYIKKQRTKFAAHIIRCPNTRNNSCLTVINTRNPETELDLCLNKLSSTPKSRETSSSSLPETENFKIENEN